MNYEKNFEEKYKEVPLKEASKYYYGTDNVMDQLLEKMQDGITQAAKEFENVKNQSEETPHVNILVDQDKLKMIFSTSVWDDDEVEYVAQQDFFTYEVGEPMAEALFLMDMMDRSGSSTGIRQATNNWMEDLDFDDFGEFDEDYSYADTWELIDY